MVGDLTDSDSSQSLQKLLYANFNGQGTGVNSLALDHLSDEVILTRAVDVKNLGSEGLKPELEDFANYFVFWKENLKKLTDSTENPPLSKHGDDLSSNFMRV